MVAINSFYKMHVMEYATVSEDGTVITLPSEKKADVRYEVRYDGEIMNCQCVGFERRHQCKHATIAKAWHDAQAIKASEVTCEVEKGKWLIVDHSQQIWLHDGKWLCSCGNGETCVHREAVKRHLENKEPVVEMPAQPIVESAPVVVQEYQMSQGVRERLAAMAKPVETAPVVVKPKWNNSAARWEDPTTGKPAATLGGVPYWNEVDGFLAHPEGKEWNDWTMQWEAPVEPVKATCRVIPNSTKRERYDLVGELTARREMKQDMLGEIAAIRERSMMNAALKSNEGFKILR